MSLAAAGGAGRIAAGRSARLLHIAVTAIVGGGCLTPRLLRFALNRDGRRLAASVGEVGVRCCWHLGPAFVKVGQIVSTRQDVLSPALCDRLRDGLAYGRGNPGATRAGASDGVKFGSVATVHRQRQGRSELAVKQLHPDAAARLERDLDLIEALGRVIARFAGGSGSQLRQILDEVCESVRGQSDLIAEAATLRRFAELELTLPVVFPTVRDAASDDRQLVMTWLPGQELAACPQNRQRVARRLVLTVYEMLFITGVVHCDLHPGNWWELPDGRLAIVDAGFAYHLDDEMQEHFSEFFLGMSSNNAETCATHALATTVNPIPPEREAAFRADLAELIGATTGLTAGDFSLASFAGKFFAIQRRHHAHSKASFIFPFMALLAIEGQVKALDPTINFQALAGKVVLRSIVARARRKQLTTSG